MDIQSLSNTLTSEQIERLNQIFNKFGGSVRTISCNEAAIDHLLWLLSYTANVKELIVGSIIDPQNIEQKLQMPNIAYLESLTLGSASTQNVRNFLDLIPVNLLHRLHLRRTGIDFYPINIIRRQSNIKHLFVDESKGDFDVRTLNSLRLESLVLRNFPLNTENLAYQNNLKTLELSLGKITNEQWIHIVPHFRNVTKLEINVHMLTTDGFCKITNLKNLDELIVKCFASENHDYFEKLVSIKNLKLKSLRLEAYDRMSGLLGKPFELDRIREIIQQIGINNPNVESLELYISTMNLLDEINQNFQKLHTLKINQCCFGYVRPFQNGFYDNLINLNLKFATLDVNVLTITDKCTNLKHLYLINCEQGTWQFKQFEHILKHNKNLTHFQFPFAENYSEIISAYQIISAINEYGRNLEFIKLISFRCDSYDGVTNGLKERFTSIFMPQKDVFIIRKRGKQIYS